LTLVRNRAIDVVRARQRRPVQPLDDTFDPPDTSDVPFLAELNVDAARAAEALDRLPPEQRAVIELAYSSGLSHTEIAARLRVPVGTVKGRIRLGLDRLRQALGVPR
jgi:RNA polymerase sigma-70 factor (ECF subfamily)